MTNTAGTFHRLSDMSELIERGAALFAEAMRDSVRDHGRFTVALSGGNTPRGVYQRLAESPYGSDLPWDKTEIFFGDERMVPPDSPESNFRMAKEALFDRVPIPAGNIHRVAGEQPPAEAAASYAQQIRDVFGAREGAVPSFGLILLGLGPDGHTASLFPGTAALDDTGDLVTAVHLNPDSAGAAHADWRVTLTYPVLNAARHVAFLVAGDDKAEPLRRVLAGDPAMPASHVHPTHGTLTWLVVDPPTEG